MLRFHSDTRHRISLAIQVDLRIKLRLFTAMTEWLFDLANSSVIGKDAVISGLLTSNLATNLGAQS